MKNGEGGEVVHLSEYRNRKRKEKAAPQNLSAAEALSSARTIVREYSSKDALIADWKRRDALDRELRYPGSALSERELRNKVDESLASQRASVAHYSKEQLLTLLSRHVREPEHFAKTYLLAMAEGYLALTERE